MEKGVKRRIAGVGAPAAVIILLVIVAMMLRTSVAFAADPIEITYSGGSRIDQVARINPDDVDHLFTINRPSMDNTVFFGGPWKEMELQNQGIPGKGLQVSPGTKVWEETGFICEKDIQIGDEFYDLKVTLEKTVNLSEHDAIFWKRYKGTNIDVFDGKDSYKDSLSPGVFCSCNVEILNSDTGEKLKLEDLWLCVSDFDCSQSFSSSNIDHSPSNLLIKKTGMFSVGNTDAASADAFINDSGLYSAPWINTPNAAPGDGADFFIGVAGLETYNMIFGFRSAAGSPLQFFTTKYRVSYRSIKGSITGITSEDVLKGGSPSGTSQEPDHGHGFLRWVTDVDIVLKSGEKISAGSTVTPEQIRNTVINRDTVFTAYNQPVYEIETEAVNGTITPGEDNVPEGQNRTVIYKPHDGHQLKELIVDEEKRDIGQFPASVAFENIKADHKVKAVFEKIPALEISKTADREVYNAGDRVTYTVVVSQTVEGAEARGVRIIDALPEGLILDEDSITGDVEVISRSADSYELLIDVLSGEVTYTYTALTEDDTDSEELINVVTARALNVPADPVQDSETVRSMKPRPVVKKMVSNQLPNKGEEVVYTISAKEPQEGIEARSVVITDAVPQGVEVLEDTLKLSGDEGSLTMTDGVIKAEIEKLSGETVIEFKARVTAEKGRVINKAILTAEGIPEMDAEAALEVTEDLPMLKTAGKDPGNSPAPQVSPLAEPQDPEIGETLKAQGPDAAVDGGKADPPPRTGDARNINGLMLLFLAAFLGVSLVFLAHLYRHSR